MTAPMTVDLNDVALLVRVVHLHSFSAAARERGVPVSTVSRHIARLESVLGIRLLERTTRRLRLTDAGGEYFAHAERAVDDLVQGGDRVRELQSEPRGRVRITAPIALGHAVAAAIYAYLEQHRGVSIDLELNDRRVDLLAEGYDIAIVPGRIDTTDFVARELMRPSRKLLYASPRYLAARGVPRKVEDLARHDCIATRAADGVAAWTLVSGRRKHKVTLDPRFHVNDSTLALRAAIAGVGIAMLPEVYCVKEVAARRLARVLDSHEGESGGVHLLYRAHRSLTAAVRTCIEHLDAVLLADRIGPRAARSPGAARPGSPSSARR